MKLRTKLIIAFVVVMIFPVTFALIAMHAFVPGRGAEIQQLYLIAVVLTTAFLSDNSVRTLKRCVSD